MNEKGLDWPAQPNLLLGKRVEIEWKNGSKYKGRVTRYYEANKIHTVLYDDNDERHYDMFTRTFQIEGESKIWTPIESEARRNELLGNSTTTNSQTSTAYSTQNYSNQNPIQNNYSSTSNNNNYGSASYGNTYTTNFNSGYNNFNYARQWVPYVSKTLNASTISRFYVLMDQRAFLNNDRVFLTGSLEVMGAWREGEGIVMNQANDNPLLWFVDVNLPFTMTDSATFGLFQFRYQIISAKDGIIIEGQGERIETNVRKSYYHVFRSNYYFPRFRGWVANTGPVVMKHLLKHELLLFRNGVTSTDQFLGIHHDITESVSECRRDVGEELFEEYLGELERENILPDINMCALFLGIIGSFGLTSSEQVYQAGAGYSYTYVNGIPVMNPNFNTVTKRLPPKPGAWSYFVANHLDVALMYKMNWSNHFGQHAFWIAKGVAEACERLSEHGSYDYYRILPLTSKFHISPRIIHKTTTTTTSGGNGSNRKKSNKTKQKIIVSNIDAITEDYLDVGSAIVVLAIEQYEQMEKEKSVLKQEVEILSNAVATTPIAGGVEVPAGDDAIGLESLLKVERVDMSSKCKNLANAWIRGLISYAPTLTSLALLFESDLILLPPVSFETMLETFCNRIQEEKLSVEANFNIFEQIVQIMPPFQCTQMVTALLKNESVDDQTLRLVVFIEMCLKNENEWRESTAVAESKSALVDVIATDITSDETQLASVEGKKGISSKFHDMNTSAKEWIRRKHSVEPAPPMVEEKRETNIISGWGFANWNNTATEKKPKKLTDLEIQQQYRDLMEDCLGDLEMVLKIPFFCHHPNGLLFELSRCWFMKGRPQNVLDALCYVGRNPTRAFSIYCPPLALFLQNKISKQLKIAALNASSTTMNTISNVFSNTSFLGHQLMYELSVCFTWPGDNDATLASLLNRDPPLTSILENELLWRMFIQWSSNTSNEELQASSPLILMLNKVKKIILTLAKSIANLTCTLRDLHIVMKSQDSFFILLNEFPGGGVSLSRYKLQSCVDELTTFDNSLEYLQTYASFFCTCGARINASDVRLTIESLRKRYDTILLNEVIGALDAIVVLPYISWLHDLRSSELFLRLWRIVGREICMESVQETRNLIMTTDDALQNEVEDEIVFGEGATEEEIQVQLAARAAIEENRLRNQFQLQDMRNTLLEQVERVELSQQVVIAQLIPRVKAAWLKLAVNTFTGVLSILELDDNFARLLTDIQIAEELRLLATCDFSEVPELAQLLKQAMIRRSASQIQDYQFLCNLRQWLPGIQKLHEYLQTLFVPTLEQDKFRKLTLEASGKIFSNMNDLTLSRIPFLVADLRDIFSLYTQHQLNFLTTLSTSPQLTEWLLQRSSTEEFNRLLQVVRPCTDEPRLLSAIASLVHIRTILLQPFYLQPPYQDGFQAFLNAFSTVDLESADSANRVGDSHAIWHLNNIISCFDALMEVFEKQTRSPGIKSCYDLKAILDRGTFVMKPSSDVSKVLIVELQNKKDSSDSNDDFTTENMEYLLDLRSKLLMTEIPVELEEEMQASVMVDAFVQQLQVLSEISDILVDLCVSGHLGYQENFVLRIPFEISGIASVQHELTQFQAIAQAWAHEVKESRRKYYFLNFFSMRDILRIRLLLNAISNPEVVTVEQIKLENSPQSNESVPPPEMFIHPDVDQMEQMGFPRESAIVALDNTNNLDSAIDFCLANSQIMDRLYAEYCSRHNMNATNDIQQFMPNILDPKQITDDHVSELLGLLHLISSHVKNEVVLELIQLWKERISQDEPLLTTLGSILKILFGKDKADCIAKLHLRTLSLPGDRVANKADLLLLLDDDETEKRLPVFVCCSESPLLVIDTVLSVYVRRGRIPEPGEIMFCTAETTAEDVNLILLRFIDAKNNGRQDFVFCIADLHNLSYTQQCTLVEKLRNLFLEYGQENASTLLLVSGLPRQVALNALSSHTVDLPPLEVKVLRNSCKEAFTLHSGETACIASEINGGGKSQYIMNLICNRQEADPSLVYCKVPIREGTTAKHLVNMLSGFKCRVAFHLDIAHIIPSSANTMLFQLVLIGVLRDPVHNRVYYRNSDDIFMIEVPNSPKNKTISALRFCNLLPYTILQVNALSLKFQRPEVSESYHQNRLVSSITMVDYFELRYVCKWLRAVKAGKLQHGGANYLADYSPWSDDQITEKECFDLLITACCKVDGPSPRPSWSIFRSFIVFMNMQFSSLEKYPLFQGGVLTYIQGLENFKSVFVRLLIETSTDFSLRSVPQIECVGPLGGSKSLSGEDLNDMVVSDVVDDLPMPPMLRGVSSELRRAEQEVTSLSPPVMVRQTSEELANRFRNMISWEESDHPIVVFNMNDLYGEVSGVDILSLQSQYIDNFINGELRASLQENSIDFNRDWSLITNEEGVQILRQIDGLSYAHRGGVDSLEPGYVMTVDNMLKMLSIQLRIRFNLPVVIMGETGAGKSTLIRNMCAILGSPLHILNIHGGMEDEDIITWMEQKIVIAQRMNDPTERVVVLLDEINTCNCMGLFKELVCDRTLNGRPLPPRIKIIAACNPYRLRKTKSLYGGEEMAGLVFEHFNASSNLENVGTGIKDPLRNLVYRVHPLPEAMIDHIFDFGALSSETESLYIKAMLRKQLEIYNGEEHHVAENTINFYGNLANVGNNMMNRYALSPFKEFVEVFSELICEAQECVRQLADGERSSASLRDVARCMKVFIWFAENFAKTKGINERWTLEDFYTLKPKAQNYVRKAVILSLSYCYHARLPRVERRTLVNAITNKWRSFQVVNTPPVLGGMGFGYGVNYGGVGGNAAYWANYYRAKCRWLNLDFSAFISVLEETQHEFVSVMNLGEGIALNEALCENLFMILVSVLNQIPVFVIGKPGSSKSLAMGLVQSNLNGDASENEFLRSLPAVEVFSYQCSPLSTSAGIEQAFESSRRYKREATNTVVVVLLDEVGLAEQSPHLPLKVLHKMLDEAGGREAVVGISNWALDPAKMNRAVHLYRPAPTVEDLSLTAEGMVRSANLKGYLHELARSYNEIYHNQEHPDFWGLREFYSTVRAINTALGAKRKETGTESVALDSSMLLNAILRNYGGRPHEMEKIVKCFFNRLGLPIPHNWKDIPVEILIKINLKEPDARHLMLLTKNNAALSLLLDRNLLKQDNTEIIFGSDFALDQTDLQIYVNIQKIKLCMAEGITVVLVHCESLYESLYDLLNQHYVEYGGQTYVRLAFGTYTRLCVIHRNFRVVVVVEKDEAYTRLAPPLLNRFEKQVFERSNVLLAEQRGLLSRLQKYAVAFATSGKSLSDSMSADVTLGTMRAAFCGYHSDMLSSLILATENVASTIDEETMSMSEVVAENARFEALFEECVSRLMWIATPESTCRLMTIDKGNQLIKMQQEFNIDIPRIYFQQQCHSSLPTFTERMLEEWRDELGSQLVVCTHSPLTHEAVRFIQQKGYLVTHVVLHELDQERELRQAVTEFFKKASSGSTLLVQCDPLATSRRRLEHSKFLIELVRAKFLKKANDKNEESIVQTATESDKIQSETSNLSAAVSESKRDEDVDVSNVRLEFGVEDDSGKVEVKITPAGAKGIHVILLLHLPRGETASESTYSIDFDTRWRIAFVDSVSSADVNGLPTAEAMIGRSIIDVFQELDAKKVIARTFRSSLSKLVCLYDRTNNDLRAQIVNITQCLEHSDFVSTVKESISNLMQHKFGKVDFDITSAALKERELQLAGSFQGALHKQILDAVSSMFAVVLSHIDRNQTLTLFTENTKANSDTALSMQTIWLYLFKQSFNAVTLLSQLKKKTTRNKVSHASTMSPKNEDIVEVKNDAFGGIGTFFSKFPFSFFLLPIIDTMRHVGENAACGETQFQRQVSTLCLDHNISGDLEDNYIVAYCYDIVNTKCRGVSNMSREQQTSVVFHLLSQLSSHHTNTSNSSFDDFSNTTFDISNESKGEEKMAFSPQKESSSKKHVENGPISPDHSSFDANKKITSLAQLHFRFWKIERILELYFDVLDTCIIGIDDALDYLHRIEGNVNSSTHIGLLNLALECIHPMKYSQQFSTLQQFRSWFTSISTLRPSFFALLDLVNAEERNPLRLKWFELEFFETFIRDVAIPIDISLSATINFVKSFSAKPSEPSIFLASKESLSKVIFALNSIYQILSAEGDIPDEYLCSITLERLEDPVVAADGYTYERRAIQEWFDLGRTRSPRTNEPLVDFILRPNTDLREKLDGEYLMSDLRRFLEYYIFDVLFSKTFRNSLPCDVIEDVICLAAGQFPNVSFPLQPGLDSILPTGKAVYGILKELFQVSNESNISAITCALDLRLNEATKGKGYMDTPLSVALVNVAEERIAIQVIAEKVDMSSLQMFKSNTYNTFHTINTIADVRYLLNAFANQICEFYADTDNGLQQENSKSFKILQKSLQEISPLLTDSGIHDLSRSMRLFLLKKVERKYGVSFLRNVFMQPLFTDSVWLQQWRESDIGFSRFMGSNRLPRVNPLMVTPFFTDLQEVIANYLKSGNVSTLDASIEEFVTKHPNDLPIIKSSLLLALFNEVGVLPLLPQHSTNQIRSLCPGLKNWIVGSPKLHFLNANERQLITFFGLNRFSCTNIAPQNFMFLDENSSSESLMRVRLIVHVVACCLSTSNVNHPFSFLYSVMMQPQSCVNSYFPGMPEDMMKMAQNVLGGRWYACPNNHPFYVDLCGRPTRIQVCATCGAQIGGEDHHLLEGNIDLGNVGTALYQTTQLQDNSERKYCFRTAQQEAQDKFFSARGLSPTVCRVIRLILHSTMIAGVCFSEQNWLNNAEGIFNKGYCNPGREVVQFLTEHVIADWESLKSLLARSADEVDLVMHLSLIQCMDSVYKNSIPPLVGVQMESPFKTLLTLESRLAWENVIGTTCTLPLLGTDEKSLTDRLAQATKKFSVDADDQPAGLFAIDLFDKYSIESLSVEERRNYAPGLFRFTKAFSFDDFVVNLNLTPHAAERFPVLWSFVITQDANQLRALQHIPSVFEWFRLLSSKFNGHIDRDTARVDTVSSVLSTIEDPIVRSKWEFAFEGFCSAWNGSWSNVQKHGCIRFSTDFNGLRMDSSVAVSFSLPNEIDEGNCPLALAHFLIDKHNTFAQLVDEVKLLRTRHQSSKSNSNTSDGADISRIQVISSKFLTPAHTIRCDIHNDFIPLIEKHCMVLSSTGKTAYDFAKAENLLIDRFLADVCAIDLEMPGFTFSHEQHLQGGLSSLRQKLKQKPLAPDVIRAIKRDITTPSQAQYILEIIETVVSFLSATGGSLVQTLNETVGDMLISKYMSTVLLMDEEIGARVIAQQIYLKNLESLWDVLNEITSLDVFEKVHAVYREPVREEVKSDLRFTILKPNFNISKLLKAMKTFILDNLIEKHISPNESVYTCLGNVEVEDMFLMDTAWFADNFPTSLKLREILSAYEYLNEIQVAVESSVAL